MSNAPTPAQADAEAILDVMQAFYDALEMMDAPAMADVWAGRPADVCVHPGWPMTHGWQSIRHSWRTIFEHTGYLQVSLSDISLEIGGRIARVCCTERRYSVYAPGTITSTVAATNLFVRTEEGWRLTLHHGSPVSGQRIAAADIN